MKQKEKNTILLFVICLVAIPCFIYKMSVADTKSVNRSNDPAKILSYITATPSKLNLPIGATEDVFRARIKVEAYYRRIKEPRLITNYTTNYKAIKDGNSAKRVVIQYTENGCTKKACVSVNFVPLSENTMPNKPLVTPPLVDEVNFPYISGYTDDTFRPSQEVTREEVATMLARIITKNAIPVLPNRFKDVSDQRYSKDAINYIVELGVMDEAAPAEFNRTGAVSHLEFKQIVNRVKQYVKDPGAGLPKGEGNTTRVEAVVAFNHLFKVKCSDLSTKERFKDITEETPYYNEILCATQPRISK